MAESQILFKVAIEFSMIYVSKRKQSISHLSGTTMTLRLCFRVTILTVTSQKPLVHQRVKSRKIQ